MKKKPVFYIICHLQLQVKHAFILCVMNNMQIMSLELLSPTRIKADVK